MTKIICASAMLLLLCHPDLHSQQRFGKNGFHLNGGITFIGPEISLGGTTGPSYGEFYVTLWTFDWEQDEKLWNKPTSGGYYLGFNYFPFYSGVHASSRLKWLIGGGLGESEERLGKDAINSVGDPTKGSWSWVELHSGVRFFATERISATGWLGYMVSQDDSKSMLKKAPKYGLTETMSKFLIHFAILLTI